MGPHTQRGEGDSLVLRQLEAGRQSDGRGALSVGVAVCPQQVGEELVVSVASAAFFGLNFGLLPSQGPRRGRWTPPHEERGRMWGSGRVLWRWPSSACPSQGPEGRGRCRFVNLEALAEENRHDPTESEGVYRGQDTSHGTGCCCLVHLEAWKGAAVAALFISRHMSRRVDAAPRRARAFTRPSLPHPSRGPRRGGETRPYGERGRLQGLGRGPWRQPLMTSTY